MRRSCLACAHLPVPPPGEKFGLCLGHAAQLLRRYEEILLVEDLAAHEGAGPEVTPAPAAPRDWLVEAELAQLVPPPAPAAPKSEEAPMPDSKRLREYAEQLAAEGEQPEEALAIARAAYDGRAALRYRRANPRQVSRAFLVQHLLEAAGSRRGEA